MDKVDQAISIIRQPATVERWQALQQLYAEASDEGESPTEREKIGELLEAFIVKAPPGVAAIALDSGVSQI